MATPKHRIPGRVRSAYAFIKAHRDEYSVQMMCRVLEVAAVAEKGLFRDLSTAILTISDEGRRRGWSSRAP